MVFGGQRGWTASRPAARYAPPRQAAHDAPPTGPDAQVAQLVEHAIENRSVGGSIPSLGTIFLKWLVAAPVWTMICNRFMTVEPLKSLPTVSVA
jgi:hypothetical protein